MLTDEEVRHSVIERLLAPTERDRQTRIGASDLANGCDRCLARAIAGRKAESDLSEKTWLGRTIGTAIHRLSESRDAEGESEVHVWFHEFERYGKVGGTIDRLLEHQIIDYKSSTRKKSALLQDWLQRQGDYREDLPPRWTKKARGGYDLSVGTGVTAHLSDNQYESEMEHMAFKFQGYVGQQGLYMRGSGRMRASLVFLNRDGVGFFDLPHGARYVDPTATHDIWVYSFGYDQAYVDALIQRGQDIIDALADGADLADFERHALCFQCGADMASEKREIDIVAEFGSAA